MRSTSQVPACTQEMRGDDGCGDKVAFSSTVSRCLPRGCGFLGVLDTSCCSFPAVHTGSSHMCISWLASQFLTLNAYLKSHIGNRVKT